MESYILILVGMVFVNNIVLAQTLGLCPLTGVSRKPQTCAPAIFRYLPIAFTMAGLTSSAFAGCAGRNH